MSKKYGVLLIYVCLSRVASYIAPSTPGIPFFSISSPYGQARLQSVHSMKPRSVALLMNRSHGFLISPRNYGDTYVITFFQLKRNTY